MKDERKTKEQLINELITLRKQVAKGEASEDKQVSEADLLLKSEMLFRFFVENANDIVFSLTPEGTLTYVSPNWMEILGHDIQEVLGQPIETFVHPEDISFCRSFLERLVATGEKQAGVKYRVKHKSGAWRWHTTNASPVRDAGGNIVSYMGIARDMTDRKLAAKALRESEEQYRLVVENAGEAIVIDQDGMHKFVNRRAIEILGYSKEALTSRPFVEFVHPDDREMVLERYSKRMKNEAAPNVYPLKIIAKDGTVKWIEIHPTLIIWNGKPATLNFFIDITDRKRAEEALRASELRYQAIFETTGTIMLIIEEDTTISLVNQGFESLTGYRKEEVEGKRKWTEFIEEDDLKKMITQHQLRRMDSDLANKSYEFRLVHKDGHLKNILLTVDIIPDTKRSIASLMDITERKQAEATVNYQRRFLRQVIDADTNLIFVKDREGRYLLANKAMACAHNTSQDAMIGKTDADLGAKPDEAVQRLKDNLEVLATGRMKLIAEESCTRPSGEVHYYQTMKYPLEDDAGKQSSVLAVGIDITERKLAEEELKESEQRLADIIEFLPDATLVIDRDAKVIAWNRAIEAMTGVKKEDMLGKGDKEYAIPFYGDRRPVLIDLALHPDTEMERQYTAIQRVGDILFGESFTPNLPPGDIHLSATASVLRDSRGEIIAAIECIRDNTERKRLEERLNRAEKMEGLGRLAGGVAHDLNNVLGVLVGYAELLAEKLPEDSPLKRYAENIQRSSMRGAAIIQDLLTLARRGVTVAEVVDLNKVIFDYLRAPEFEKLKSYHPNVKVWTEFQEGLLNIKGSPVHLSKTIMNLVSNAAEAIPDQGEVTIRTENRYLDQPIRGYDDMAEGDYAVLTVKDSGKGIPAQDLGKIFEPFYTKKIMGRSGTGLGLAVVWGTVKDHNGYIDVQSEEGKGTTFILYFPVTREELTTAKEIVSPSIYMGRGESILVVDDVKEQRELAVSMLGRLGYHVEAVSSGEAAIKYLKNKKVDLVVLDMIMDPGIDGLETYRRMIEIEPEQKAIIVSGFSETDQVREAQEIGAGSFIRKPYILEKMGLAVRKELDKSRS